jgi:hypothetical protein
MTPDATVSLAGRGTASGGVASPGLGDVTTGVQYVASRLSSGTGRVVHYRQTWTVVDGNAVEQRVARYAVCGTGPVWYAPDPAWIDVPDVSGQRVCVRCHNITGGPA